MPAASAVLLLERGRATNRKGPHNGTRASHESVTGGTSAPSAQRTGGVQRARQLSPFLSPTTQEAQTPPPAPSLSGAQEPQRNTNPPSARFVGTRAIHACSTPAFRARAPCTVGGDVGVRRPSARIPRPNGQRPQPGRGRGGAQVFLPADPSCLTRAVARSVDASRTHTGLRRRHPTGAGAVWPTLWPKKRHTAMCPSHSEGLPCQGTPALPPQLRRRQRPERRTRKPGRGQPRVRRAGRASVQSREVPEGSAESRDQVAVYADRAGASPSRAKSGQSPTKERKQQTPQHQKQDDKSKQAPGPEGPRRQVCAMWIRRVSAGTASGKWQQPQKTSAAENRKLGGSRRGRQRGGGSSATHSIEKTCTHVLQLREVARGGGTSSSFRYRGEASGADACLPACCTPCCATGARLATSVVRDVRQRGRNRFVTGRQTARRHTGTMEQWRGRWANDHPGEAPAPHVARTRASRPRQPLLLRKPESLLCTKSQETRTGTG